MADEEQFLHLVVTRAKFDQLLNHSLDSAHPGRQIQALKELARCVEKENAMFEEAREAGLAKKLTSLLAQTSNTLVLDAIALLLGALSGAHVHSSRLLEFRYEGVGVIRLSECALREGVGARLWSISHAFNMFLIANRKRLESSDVLELGAGVGSTGVVVKKLGAREVVVSDLTLPLLQNLYETCLLNCPEHSSANESDRILDHLCEFSEAETVSDENLLLDDCVGGLNDDADEIVSEVIQRRKGISALWDVENMFVRLLDWKAEWDAWCSQQEPNQGARGCIIQYLSKNVDDTTSFLETANIQPLLSSQNPRDTFDVPSEVEGLPPTVSQSKIFDIVIGCEVLYEMPHAAWVPATLKLRLAEGGTAWVAGAVRDMKVCLEAVT